MTTRGTLQLRPATPGAHTRPGDARRKIHFALKVIEQALQVIGDFAGHLPEWTERHRSADGRICERPEAKVVTNGMTQQCTYFPETHLAVNGGLSDYGDEASSHYLECVGCAQLFRLPDDLDWR